MALQLYGLAGVLLRKFLMSFHPVVYITALSSLSIHWASVTRLYQNVFKNCSSLTGTYSFPGVTEISSNAMTGFAMTNITFGALTAITNSYAPSGCLATSTSMPELTVISATRAFSECRNLTTLSLPKLQRITATQTFITCIATRGLQRRNVRVPGSDKKRQKPENSGNICMQPAIYGINRQC